MRATTSGWASRRRGVTLVLIALALWMRLMIPQGWMPSRAASGWTLTLCTGSGAMPAPMAMGGAMGHAHGAGAAHAGPAGHGHEPGHEHKGMDQHPCAFAGAAQALAEPSWPPVLPLPPAAAPALLVAALSAVTIGHGLPAPPPPATGPPQPA